LAASSPRTSDDGAGLVRSSSGRTKGKSGENNKEIVVTMRFGSFELDAARRQLLRDGQELHLTPKAFTLLAILIEGAPRVMSKAELHERLWPNGLVTDATLVGLVKEIRRVLSDDDDEAPIIRTVHRVGYAFDAQVTRAARPTAMGRWLLALERRIPLVAGENVLGRDPEANVCLEHSTVSRRHARLMVHESGALLEDLGSKNGTTLNGERLTKPTTLRNGDRFFCGQLLVAYVESSAAVPTATQVNAIDGAPARR
jgi:DNA-binding winged helix-turn-helix (wHTH) protein